MLSCFFTGKFLPGLALVLGLELPAGRGCVGAEFEWGPFVVEGVPFAGRALD